MAEIVQVSGWVIALVTFLLGCFAGWAVRDIQWRRAEVERQRREIDGRKRRKLEDTQRNIGQRITNALKDQGDFLVVGYEYTEGDKKTFRVRITSNKEVSQQEELALIEVNAFAGLGEMNSVILGEKNYYSLSNDSIKFVIEDVLRSLTRR